MPSFSQILSQAVTDSGVKPTSVYSLVASLPLTGNADGDIAYVQETSRLYIWSGSGWYNIALINTAPSITGGVNASYEFATDGTPIVITAVGSDPEGLPLTWSYSVTTGSLTNGGGATATVSQADNVFTITPTTNSAYAGEFSITFTASDGINLATAASSFTLSFGTADAYYNLNSTLIKTGSTAGLTNTTIIDESSNAFTVTRTGDVYQGSYSPYSPAGWSGYFDGTGDYLTAAASSQFAYGTGDFTVELWASDSSGNGGMVYSQSGFTISINSFGALVVSINTLNINTMNFGPNPFLNRWAHVAIARQGSTIRCYVNGEEKFSGSDSSSVTGTPTPYIGSNLGSNSFWTGYISDVRVVKGTAVYTSAFTPPTSKLTAISGTSLLTLQDNRFVDRSTNNFAITRAGDVSVVPNSPYLPSEKYDPIVHSGSAYFDADGDYLQLPADAGFSFGTGDFTVEAWIYYPPITGQTNGRIFFDSRPTSTNGSYWIFGTSNSGVVGFTSMTSGGITILDTVARPNQWVHYAATRSGTSLRLFANGTLVASGTDSSNISSSGLMIGKNAFSSVAADTWWRGYISDARIVKGTALYTSNFTPPTQSLTAVSGTSLLLKMNNAGIYDETAKTNINLIGNTQTSTTQTKYNDTAIYFDGNDHLTVNHDALGTGNWTIEGWVYFNVIQNTYIFDFRSSNNTNPALDIQNDWRYISDGAYRITSNVTPSANTWYHFAVVKNSGTTTLYINGSSIGTYADSLNYVGNTSGIIGRYHGGAGNYLNGYIEDFRITKGVARYTANFTPPTAALGFSNAE